MLPSTLKLLTGLSMKHSEILGYTSIAPLKLIMYERKTVCYNGFTHNHSDWISRAQNTKYMAYTIQSPLFFHKLEKHNINAYTFEVCLFFHWAAP